MEVSPLVEVIIGAAAGVGLADLISGVIELLRG